MEQSAIKDLEVIDHAPGGRLLDYCKRVISGWMWEGASKCKVGRYLYSKESDYIVKREREESG